MKSVALWIILFSCSAGITAANGQAFRSSTVAPRNWGVTAQTGPTVIQTGPRFAPGAIRPVPRGAFAPAPNVFIQGPVPVIVPRIVPHHHFHPPLLRRHPGILIIDLPYVSDRTVITLVAPGVVREDRRYGENPRSERRTRSAGQLAPFDPTPQEVVERMLALAEVKPGDVLYDLGAGDGRIVIAAAKKYGVKAVGFEIDPGLVKLARENVRRQGVENLVEIRAQDFGALMPSARRLVLTIAGTGMQVFTAIRKATEDESYLAQQAKLELKGLRIIKQGERFELEFSADVLREIAKNLNEEKQRPSIRTGCPALSVSGAEGPNVVNDYFDWAYSLTKKYYLPTLEK